MHSGLLVILAILQCKYVVSFPSYKSASHSDSLSFIVNGQNTTATQFPFHVSLFYNNVTEDSDFFLCSGAIINESHIVTSASAVRPYLNTTLNIYAGSNEYMAPDGIQFFMTNYKLHENYSSDTFENDIALVQVGTPFTFTDRIQPIAISTNWTADTSLQCTVSSFADPTTTEGAETGIAEFLEWTNTTVAACPGTSQPSDSLFCAVDASTKVQTSNVTDQGSPMVCNSKLVGVATASLSGYFTNITKYYDWIFPHSEPITEAPSNTTAAPASNTTVPASNTTAAPAEDSFLSNDTFRYAVIVIVIAIAISLAFIILKCLSALF